MSCSWPPSSNSPIIVQHRMPGWKSTKNRVGQGPEFGVSLAAAEVLRRGLRTGTIPAEEKFVYGHQPADEEARARRNDPRTPSFAFPQGASPEFLITGACRPRGRLYPLRLAALAPRRTGWPLLLAADARYTYSCASRLFRFQSASRSRLAPRRCVAIGFANLG